MIPSGGPVKIKKMNLDTLLESQRTFFKSGKTRDLDLIKSRLKKLSTRISDHEQEIYEALDRDFQKPKFETYLSEIGIVQSELKLAIKNLKKWSKPKTVFPALLNFPSSEYIYSQPYGTILVIAPWNYPFQLAMVPIISAIAAGNTVVLKPSELTPNTSNLMDKMLSEIFEKEHLCTVQGGVEVATELLEKKWNYIFFTGSVPVGKIIYKAAAKQLTPVTLELGGKSPCIIDRGVNMSLVAKRIVWGKYLNCGQTCIAPDYILVDKAVKDELIEKLKLEIEKAYGKDPKESPDLARIINQKNHRRMQELMEGQTILYGGDHDETSLYFSPTLIDEPSMESKIMKEEIFGPLFPIISYDSRDKIDKIIGSLSFPLSFYVFSNKKKFRSDLMKNYRYGGGVINDTLIHYGNHRLPFGGIGDSGIGAYHGKLGFDIFTHKKAVVKKANWLDMPVRYAPYKGKLSALKRFFKLLG